jgi:hypothetical protein
VTETKAILAIIVGCVLIVLGFIMKEFYAAKGITGVALSDKRIATWQGRLLFLVVGGVMLLVGIKFLMFPQ